MKKLPKYKNLRRKAAKLIETYGWTRGEMQNGENGALCLVGALTLAATGGADNYYNTREIGGACLAMGFKLSEAEIKDFDSRAEAIEEILPEDAISWNDAKRRRKGEVLARLRKGL